MAGDDLFKRYLEIGASVLGMSRERAERIVADLVASGEVARGQATKAADWLVERGKTGSEEIAELIRREIREQMSALGVATKDDIARLQAEIDELRSSRPPAPKAAPKPRARATKSPPAGGADPAKG
jgi:polyhydroxyalkanoate synthesis regulator phasin